MNKTYFGQTIVSIVAALSLLAVSLCLPFGQVQAKEGQVLGIHILHPDELNQAKQLFSIPGSETEQSDTADEWHYVTVPFAFDDLQRKAEWQDFFNQAKDQKIIPIVRLMTRFENNAWVVPNRKQMVDQIHFLASLDWPTDQKHLIIYNEVNHAGEWGGQIDPESYVKTLRFAAQWAHAESDSFVVMPAAMDLAAPQGGATAEAFWYLGQMLAIDPDIFSYIDVWNSHSYPNPGFSSSPERTAKNSLRGFEHELAFLKQKTSRDYDVFITETGWQANRATLPWLERYYEYALQHIWSDPRVLGVTPFVLKGDPGPFSSFGFLDRNNQPTAQYIAFQRAVERVENGQ